LIRSPDSLNVSIPPLPCRDSAVFSPSQVPAVASFLP
jgi:hypothetical protein